MAAESSRPPGRASASHESPAPTGDGVRGRSPQGDTSEPPLGLDAEIDDLFARPMDEGLTLALVIVRHGEIVAERYGRRPANLFQSEEAPILADTPLISWSIAKSMTHAALGVLVGDGRIDPADPAPVPEWAGTEKESITLLDLLEMRSGLQFVEDYVHGETSDVIEMLFGSGATDHAAYAAGLPLLHAPGTVWSYSSGATNILCRILGDLVGAGAATAAEREAATRAFLDQRLFAPAGMPDADPRFDEVGTFAGSSYVHAPARQFARFGELFLHDGVVGDVRVLPEGWLDHARTMVAVDPETGFGYGRHWWIWRDQPGSLAAHGYEGQYLVVLPELDAVVVHLGKTDATARDRLVAHLRRIIATL
jgi:CubicO group peptidase (beta-lactamase class C family)